MEGLHKGDLTNTPIAKSVGVTLSVNERYWFHASTEVTLALTSDQQSLSFAEIGSQDTISPWRNISREKNYERYI